MFCSRCGKPITEGHCQACGQLTPQRRRLLREHTTAEAGDRRLLQVLRLVALACAGAVAVMLAVTLLRQ